MGPEQSWLEVTRRFAGDLSPILVESAWNLTGARGGIVVGIEAGRAAVAVRVADAGGGIAADVLPHVFEMFAQGEAGGGGLGVGLAVVRAVVEEHGGTVEARSDGPGSGSEFIERLPLAR